MNRKPSTKQTGAFLLWFTALYVLCMGLRVWYFVRAGRSMICDADALEQHINALTAYGKWIRGLVYALVREHRLAWQSYSFGIGLGADFYTSMQYYAVGEPLNLIVAFLPASAVYYWYQLLILLRPYLAGLSFLTLCLWRDREGIREHFADRPLSRCAMLGGALIYSFSGTVLFIGMWNPFFVIPMITLPLLILGLDRLLIEKRCAPFVLAVFLAGVSNFYFFYMQVLFLFGYYALRRIFDRPRTPDGAKIPAGQSSPGHRADASGGPSDRPGATFLRFLLSGALGVSMAGVLLLPMFLALLDNPRSGGHALPPVYHAEYYRELLRNLILYVYHPLHDTELGLTIWAPLLFLALPVLAWKRRGLKRELAELLILTLMLVLPVFGYVLSGFSSALNRWCFAVALFTGWLYVREYPFWAGLVRRVFSGRLSGKPEGEPRDREMIPGLLLSVPILLCILWSVTLSDAPDRGNLPGGFIERMTGREFQERLMLTEVNALTQTVVTAPDTHVRYAARNPVWNASLLHGISSTQFYWSLANGAVAELFSDLAVNDMANYCYLGFEDRAMLMDLAGVTHYTLRFDTEEEQRYVPAGFVRTADYYNFAIYENSYPVGLGTVYDRVLSAGDWETLAPWDREEVMLGAAVLGDGDLQTAALAGIGKTSPGELVLTAEMHAVKALPEEGVSWERNPDGTGGRFIVTGRDGGTAQLLFGDLPELADGGEPRETGLFLGGLTVDGPRDIVNIDVHAYTGMEALEGALPDDTDAQVCRTLSYKTPESEFYSGWHNYYINLGSAAGPFAGVRICFPAAGTYTVQQLAAVTRPVGERFDEARRSLAAHSAQEVSLNKNPVSLMTDEVTLFARTEEGEAGILMLTIPWQRGWRAYVDGEETPLFRANTAFMGLVLSPGLHEITLRYRTPGLLAGLLFTLAGLAAFLWLMMREGKNGHK